MNDTVVFSTVMRSFSQSLFPFPVSPTFLSFEQVGRFRRYNVLVVLFQLSSYFFSEKHSNLLVENTDYCIVNHVYESRMP